MVISRKKDSGSGTLQGDILFEGHQITKSFTLSCDTVMKKCPFRMLGLHHIKLEPFSDITPHQLVVQCCKRRACHFNTTACDKTYRPGLNVFGEVL